jgi:hypothetical protein
MSETEVSVLRRPGDLIFTSGNEIMTVPVATVSTTYEVGDPVVINDDGKAVLATSSNFDNTSGYGVIIHEGVTTGAALADEVVQIATGNAYVAMKANAVVRAFKQLSLSADGDVQQSARAAYTGSVTLAMINGIINWQKGIIGRSYGGPGEVVNPQSVAANGTVVVRLGHD